MLGGDFYQLLEMEIHSVLMAIFTFHFSVWSLEHDVYQNIKKYSQTERLAKVYQFFFADLNWKSFA